MRKIAIALSKCGLAKTATADYMAHYPAEQAHRVLFIDTDTQARCSRLLGVDPEKCLADLPDGASAKGTKMTRCRRTPGRCLCDCTTVFQGCSTPVHNVRNLEMETSEAERRIVAIKR